MLDLKHGFKVWCQRIGLPDSQVMSEAGLSGYKYFYVLDGRDIAQSEMKNNITFEYFTRIKVVIKSSNCVQGKYYKLYLGISN